MSKKEEAVVIVDTLQENEEQTKVNRFDADTEMRLIKQVAAALKIGVQAVQTTVGLLDEGNTIPFISRYRKEMTGSLDEQQIDAINEAIGMIRRLEQRKRDVIRLIGDQGNLTEELRQQIESADSTQRVDDLYRPFRPKRKTRASIAKERGLEPLANWIYAQPKTADLLQEATKYIVEKDVPTAEAAIQGALDILAERVADEAETRAALRQLIWKEAMLRTEAANPKAESVYEMYYDFKEPLKKWPPHRILAMNRGEREDILKVHMDMPVDRAVAWLERKWLKPFSAVREVLSGMLLDAYKRLLFPALEREIRNQMTETAEAHAIDIFGKNLRQLLLQPPVQGHRVLGVDPAYRTGCKLAVIDETGKMLHVSVIYPTAPHHKVAEAEKVVLELIRQFSISLIAIGNGTASRESEQFVADCIRKSGREDLKYLIVNEAGASVYSASKLAQKEFPKLDVAERSAVSIARRLQDPLAELVKIDPQSVGVGQYQHDVGQKRLAERLRFVVETAVNQVGVDVNTASPSLLSYVSGVSSTVADQIVAYREKNGKFRSRAELKDVPRLGPKTYEQCIGFMRIYDGTEQLDQTSIHPESYSLAKALLHSLGVTGPLGSERVHSAVEEAMTPEQLKQWTAKLQPLAAHPIGEPTVKDLLEQIRRPGRDPREELPPPLFRNDVLQLDDVVEGMQFKGAVRNITDFGAFIDIGVKNDGLVHLSKMSKTFVKHPLDVVSVGDIVDVWVVGVDRAKGRVSLTMLPPAPKAE
jgi:uncharacterized protein